MNEITYTYKRTKEDVMTHTIWHRFFKSPFSIILNFVFPVMALFLIITSIWLPVDMLFYIATIYLILMPFVNLWLIRMRINRLFDNPEMDMEETTFTYTTEGIKTESVRGELLLEWEFIRNVYVVKNYIYVYVDRINSFLINQDAIGETMSKQILDLFDEHLPKGSVKYRKQKSA